MALDPHQRCGHATGGDPYQWVARVYDLLLDPWLRPVHRAVTDVCRREGAVRVVDLCCGTGAQCRRLHRAGLEVTGVDISAAMVARARFKAPADLPIVHGDAAHTSFVADHFDAAVISFAVHEKPLLQRLALLAEAARLVRSGGVICIADFLSRSASSRSGHWARTIMELCAGHAHFACYRDYLARGAMPGLLACLDWMGHVEQTFHRRSSGLYVIRPSYCGTANCQTQRRHGP